MLWQLQASHIRFLVAITWVTCSERTPNTLPETNSNLTPEIDPTRKRSYSNHQWYICRLFQPATAVAVQVISTTLSEDWTVWSWMQIEFISKESMATQALSYSPAPHHPSIASIHSQIKMSSGKIYLQKKSTAKPIGVTGIGQTGNIWSETSMLYTWCFGEKTWSLQAFTSRRSFPTSSVMFQEGLRLPKNSSKPIYQCFRWARKKTRTFHGNPGCLNIWILIVVYEINEIIPTSLGSISSPIYPKQRFGSLVARALNHKVPIGISSLCTRYTSFYRVAGNTRPRTQKNASGHVWNCHKCNHRFGTCFKYRSSRLRSTLYTNVITGLDMFQVCTEAVDCVALCTRTSSQVWTFFKYVPTQLIA